MSSRYPSVSELAALLAVQASQTPGDIARYTAREIERDVETLCRSLLTCNRGFVGPFHVKVREFFHDQSCPEGLRIEQDSAHGMFAETCLKCLRFIHIPSDSRAGTQEPLRYAADNLFYHTVQALETKQLELASLTRKFLLPQERFMAWLRFVWEEGEIMKRDLVLMQLKSAILIKDFELSIPENVTPIHIVALVTTSKDLFARIILEKGDKGECFNLQHTDDQGRTAVHWAAGQEGYTRNLSGKISFKEDEIINLLLEQGLTADMECKNGRRPLHIAAQHGRRENIITLLTHGVDFNAKEAASLIPLHLSVLFPDSQEALSELINVGPELDAHDKDGWTPLHVAAQNGHVEAINALVAAKASVDARTEKQSTPLHLAAQDGHVEAINALVAAKASVDARTEKQSTPLHLAAQNGHVEAINALVAAKAIVDAREEDQWTPLQNVVLDLLSALRNLPAIRLLRSKTGHGTLRNDLLRLISAVASDDFDFDRLKPLLRAVLNKEDDDTIWKEVYRATVESTPPPRQIASALEQTPGVYNTSSLANSSEHRKHVDAVLTEELGPMYVGLRDFQDIFFRDIPDLETASEVTFKRCMEGDDLAHK